MGDNVHYFYQPVKLVEGFDMVGKTSFMAEVLPNTVVYHPNHDLTDKTVGRNESWTIGYGIIDMLSQLKEKSPDQYTSLDIAIDRGVFSSYVYKRLYQCKYLKDDIIDYYRSSEFFKSLGHIYIVHHDASSAEEIFESAKSRPKDDNETSNKLDTFNSFRDYWVMYCNADLLFREVYSKVGVKPRVFETYPDHHWEEVRMR